jgi:MFS family permease
MPGPGESLDERAAAPALRWSLVALVCLGIWLHAADALVTTTVMPSAIADIGGLPFVYWTLALYELGSIVAGAAAGLVAVRVGFRLAMSVAATVYALGCAASALAPDMAVMLVGRLVQGLGGGAMLALSYVGVSLLFPAPLWPRVLAFMSGVWGVSALVGPLVGGAFAQAGFWRGAFWAFAAQAMVLIAVTPMLVEEHAPAATPAAPIPRWQLLALGIGVLAVSAAGVQEHAIGMIVCTALGLVALRAVLVLEGSAVERLFPPTPLARGVAWGPGYVMVLAMATATVSFTVYGPLLLAALYGVTPLTAGFLVALESVSWTIAAILFAGASARAESHLIRAGAVLIAAGVAGLALVMPRGPVWALVPWVTLQGAGFGMCWAFLLRRIVESVPDTERERASSAVPTMQMIGYAVGAAAAGALVNTLGFTEAAPPGVSRRVAFWVFAAFLPLAALGVVAAWRVSAEPADRAG